MEEFLALKWHSFDSNFFSNLSKYRLKEDLCDATLVCEEKYFPVHKLVLSVCSEYFEGIFSRTPCKHPFIIIKDLSASFLQYLLQFMYEGEVRVPRESLPPLLIAANALQIKGISSNGKPINDSGSRYQNNSSRLPSSSSNHKSRSESVIQINVNTSNKEVPAPALEQLQNHENDTDNLSATLNVSDKQPQNKRARKQRSSKILAYEKLKIMNSNASASQDSNDDILYQDEEILAHPNEPEGGTGITIVSYAGNSNQAFENGQMISMNAELQVDEMVAIKVEPTEISGEFDYDYGTSNLESGSYDENFINTNVSSAAVLMDGESVYVDRPVADPFSTIGISDPFVNDVVLPPVPVRPRKRGRPRTNMANKLSALRTCLQCPFECWGGKAMKRHVKVEHLANEGPKQLTCKHCPFICGSKQYLASHERTHSSKTSYQCRFCYYRSVSSWNCMMHEKNHTTDKKQGLSVKRRSKLKLKEDDYPNETEDDAPLNHMESSDDIPDNNENLVTAESEKPLNWMEKVKENLNDEEKISNSDNIKSNIEPSTIELNSTDQKRYKCSICNYRSKFRNYVDAHLNVHTKKKLFDCSKCSFTSPFRAAIMSHMKKRHFKNKNTKKKGLYNRNFYRTASTDENNLFCCQYCPTKFAHKNNIIRHEARNHTTNEKKRFHCKQCSFKTNHMKTLNDHDKVHSFTKMDVFHCPHCSFSTLFSSHMKKHITSKHRQNKVVHQNNPGDLETEEVQDENRKSDETQLDFNPQDSIPADEENNSTNTLVSVDANAVPNDDPDKVSAIKTNQCKYCRYMAPSSSQLSLHYNMHTGAKPIRCKICSYRCNFHSNLKIHMLKHKK